MKWGPVAEELGPRLYRYFCVRFDAVTADDLTQETLIRLVQKVEERLFDPGRGTLQMLAFGIANYVAMEQRKRIGIYLHRQSEQEAEEGQTEGVEETLLRRERLEDLRSKIAALSELEQQVLSLSMDEEFKMTEIAKLLKIPENTVKSHIHRAKQKLKTMYEKENTL